MRLGLPLLVALSVKAAGLGIVGRTTLALSSASIALWGGCEWVNDSNDLGP